MGSVPITLTSPLDLLYNKFPVVIVENWSQVFEPGFLAGKKRSLMLKFGPEPFENATVKEMLTSHYWKDVVSGRRPW
jgi:hypothetical protein